MIVVLHVVAGAAVAHAASARLRRATGEFVRPRAGLVLVACLLALLSHGVLDGLKHGYPISAVPDIVLGAGLAAAWCLSVRRPLRLLFAAVIAAALLPDVIDHGTAMLRWQAGMDVSVNRTHVFPWHWPEGSGSLHPGGGDPARSLDYGRHRSVSTANQLIVLFIAAGCVLTNTRAFRFVRDPIDVPA